MFNKISQIKAWTTSSKLNKADPKYLFRNYFKKKNEKISPLSSPEEFSKTINGHVDESYADGFSTTKNKSHESELSFESKLHSLSQNLSILQAESPTLPDMQSSTSHEAQLNIPSPPPECSTSLVNTANTQNGLSLDSPGIDICSQETCEQVNNDSNSLNNEFQGMKSYEIFSKELPSPSSNVSMKTKKAASNSQVELLSSQRNISKKENKRTSSQTSKLSTQPAKGTLKSKKHFFSDKNKMINNPNIIKYNLMSTEGNDKSSLRGRKDNLVLDQSPQSSSPRRKVCSTNKASKLGARRTSSHSVDKMMDTKQVSLPRVSSSKSPKRSCTVDSSKSRKKSSPSEKSSTRSHPLITGSLQVNSVSPIVNKSPSRKSSLKGGKDKLVSPQLKVRNSSLENLSNSEKISIYSKEKIITTKESTVLKSQRKCSKADLSKKLSKKSKQPIDGILQPKAVTTASDKTPIAVETNLLHLENLKTASVTKKPPKSKKISQNSEKKTLQRASLSGHGCTPKTQRVKAPRPKKSAPMNKVKNEKVSSSSTSENPCTRYEKLSAPDLLSSPPSKLLIPLSSHSFSTASLSPRNSSFVSITPSASSSSNVKTVILKEHSPSATSSTSQGNSSFVSMLPMASSSSNVNNVVLEKPLTPTKTQDFPCLVSSMHSEKNSSQLSKDSNSSSMTSLLSKDASLFSDNALSSTNETLITLSGNILANLENILETSEGMLLPTQNIEKEKRHHKSISNHLQISSSYNQKDVSPCEIDCDIVTEFSSPSKDNSFLLGNSLNSEYKAYPSESSSGSKTEQSSMCCGITSRPAARLSLTSCCKTVSSGNKESSESSTSSFYCRGESTMTQILKLFCSFLILLMLSTTTLVMIVNRFNSK